MHDAAHDWLARRQGGLDPATERSFAAWLAADPRHRRAYALAQETWNDSRLLAQSGAGRARRLPRAPFYMRRRTQVGAAGLALAALAGVVLMMGVVERGGPFALVTPADATTYATGRGEIRAVTLADGSRVTLDTATVLQVRFTAAGRRVALKRGRARFEVAADDRRPFTVAVAGTDIVAQGRVFDVSMAGNVPLVAVFDGAVAWQGPDGGGQRTLVAGQQTVLAARTGSFAVAPAETRWVTGMLALDATPLGEAVAAINRYNGVQIRLADPALAVLRVTGAFHVRDPDGFAGAVAATFGLTVTRDGDAIVVTQRARSVAVEGVLPVAMA